jgi:hypothetical protein
MALGAADLERIIKYQAFDLGSNAGGPLTWQSVMQLVQNQINFVNANDVRFGTDIAGRIQADLDQMDADDEAQSASSAQGNIKRVDVIEYFQGGAVSGYSANVNRLRRRVAMMLSQTFENSATMGVTALGQG